LATEASEQVATRFVAAIEAHFEPLRRFPLAGPSREQLASGLRVRQQGRPSVVSRYTQENPAKDA